MASDAYHEPYDLLSPPTRDMHRAITTLIEELEAIDWYQQRAEACTDLELRAVLVHNKNEEIEHALMTLEWLRRRSAEFDENIRTYLNAEGPITEIEAREDVAGNGAELAAPGPEGARAAIAAVAPAAAAARAAAPSTSTSTSTSTSAASRALGIGSLKEG